MKQVLNSAASCHGSLTTCRCSAGYVLTLVTLVYILNSIHSVMYHFRRSGYSSISWSLLSTLLSTASLTDPDFFKFSLFTCPQFHNQCVLYLCNIFLSVGSLDFPFKSLRYGKVSFVWDLTAAL